MSFLSFLNASNQTAPAQPVLQANPVAPSYLITQDSQRRIIILTPSGAPICNDTQCQKSSDLVAQRLYQTVTKIYTFFKEIFGLEGINGKGEIAPLRIHWDEKNATWSCP